MNTLVDRVRIDTDGVEELKKYAGGLEDTFILLFTTLIFNWQKRMSKFTDFQSTYGVYVSEQSEWISDGLATNKLLEVKHKLSMAFEDILKDNRLSCDGFTNGKKNLDNVYQSFYSTYVTNFYIYEVSLTNELRNQFDKMSA